MEFHRSRKIDAQIDMTPMIDTLLQLFLIFLLSASFVASSVRLSLPRATAGNKAPGEPIVVSVDAYNKLFVNNETMTPGELAARLPALFRKRGKQEVILRADQNLAYKDVIKALVALERAGAKSVHMAYNEEKAK